MRVEVVDAEPKEKRVLERLLQLYSYDFSEFTNDDVDAAGLFEEEQLDRWWSEAGRHPFLVRVDGQLAGLALVREQSAFTGDTDVTDMVEFFIMRKYRRQGAGAAAATRLFDLFPGRWEVRQIAANTPAQAFWRKVIGDYTGGRYEERFVESEQWHGPYQSFDTREREG
jgi:predicted acetyltransferase